MKTLRAFGLFFFLSAMMLLADDSYWVEKTFQWTGNGTINTQAFPLFGDEFSVRYLSPKAGLQVIFVPLDRASKKTLKSKSVISTKVPVTKTGRKDFDTPINDEAKKEDTALCWGYLFISGKGPWNIAIDQHVDTFQSWHLEQYLKGDTGDGPTAALGVWAEQGTQSFTFAPTVSPWKINVVPEDDGLLNVRVRKADQKIYFESTGNKAGETKSGWIYSLEPVTIEVNCATDEQRWSIESSTR